MDIKAVQANMQIALEKIEVAITDLNGQLFSEARHEQCPSHIWIQRREHNHPCGIPEPSWRIEWMRRLLPFKGDENR